MPYHVPDEAPINRPAVAAAAPTSRWSRTYFADLAERVCATFLAALLGAVALTSGTAVDWSDGKAIWAVLGVPTVVSLIKGILANVADSESGPSLLPAPPAPEIPEAPQD